MTFHEASYSSCKHRFGPAMATKYAKDWDNNKVGSIENKISDKKTKYLRLGYTQNLRKVEMAKCGAAITKKRGLPAPAYTESK